AFVTPAGEEVLADQPTNGTMRARAPMDAAYVRYGADHAALRTIELRSRLASKWDNVTHACASRYSNSLLAQRARRVLTIAGTRGTCAASHCRYSVGTSRQAVPLCFPNSSVCTLNDRHSSTEIGRAHV